MPSVCRSSSRSLCAGRLRSVRYPALERHRSRSRDHRAVPPPAHRARGRSRRAWRICCPGGAATRLRAGPGRDHRRQAASSPLAGHRAGRRPARRRAAAVWLALVGHRSLRQGDRRRRTAAGRSCVGTCFAEDPPGAPLRGPRPRLGSGSLAWPKTASDRAIDLYAARSLRRAKGRATASGIAHDRSK